MRILVPAFWFYEFDSRVHPQIPYAVFPLESPFFLMCGLVSWYATAHNEILHQHIHDRVAIMMNR